MTWLIFSVISVVFAVTYGLISKKLLTDNDETDPIAYASLLFLSVAIISTLLYLISGARLSDFDAFRSSNFLMLLTANVILYAVAPSFYYRALKNIPISEVTVLYTLTGFYTLILGIVLNTEQFLITRLIGGLIILSAVFLVERGKGKWAWNRYVLMLVGGTLVYALAAITDNQIIANNYLPTLLFQALNFGIPAFIILLINPKSIKGVGAIIRNVKLIRIIPLNAVFFFVSFFSIFSAYKSGGTSSQVNIFLATETIVTIIFAWIFLRERDNFKLKVLVGVLASIGVYLLK